MAVIEALSNILVTYVHSCRPVKLRSQLIYIMQVRRQMERRRKINHKIMIKKPILKLLLIAVKIRRKAEKVILVQPIILTARKSNWNCRMQPDSNGTSAKEKYFWWNISTCKNSARMLLLWEFFKHQFLLNRYLTGYT